ncbi:feruloyl-CoA synthase [Bradyrhizobium elkanii]
MTMAAASGDNPSSLFATPAIVAASRNDGSILVRSTTPLKQGARCVGDWLEHWARLAPDRIFLGERANAEVPWSTVSYRDALGIVRRAASWVLAQGLSAERPLVILSDNGIDHALFALAAQHVGVPSAAISPAYSLMSRDFDKLKGMIELLDPGAIYATSTGPFAAALAAIKPLHRATIVSGNPDDADALPFRAVAATPEAPGVATAFAAVTADTIAKLLFTSGSTGTPKAVINTQRMLTSSQQAKAQTWTFLEQSRDDLVILDWLPWSHTFGANHNFNLVLRNGGTLYIDGGKPAPGLFATSLANLRSVVPTVYFNVPRGFDMLIAALRTDDELRRKFFEGTKFAFYAGAALPQNLWDALEDLSLRTVGRRLPMVSAWGSTETSPLATDCHFLAKRSGNIGVPIPGTELKLVPSGDKLEVRVRGPNVTPGYWKAPELTAEAFDDEGFYKIGDAVTFADPARPDLGLFFDGRVAEDFKAQFRHLGQRRHLARRRHRGAGAARAGHRRHRPWPRRGALPGVSESRRLPRAGRPARERRCAGSDRPSGGPFRDRAGAGDAEGAGRPFLRPCHACAAAGRARLGRRRGDHRQGLHQPARRADAPRRSGGGIGGRWVG